MKLTFGKEEHLKSRKLIEQLFEEGDSFFHYPYKIMYLKSPYPKGKYPTKTGIAVSKRQFKSAVDRNQVKRIFRETFRLQKRSLYEVLEVQDHEYAVMWIFVGKKMPEYNDLFLQTGKCIDKLIKRLIPQPKIENLD